MTTPNEWHSGGRHDGGSQGNVSVTRRRPDVGPDHDIPRPVEATPEPGTEE